MKNLSKILLSIAILGSTTLKCADKSSKELRHSLTDLIKTIDGNKYFTKNGNPTSRLNTKIKSFTKALKACKDMDLSSKVHRDLRSAIRKLSNNFGGMAETMIIIEIQNSFLNEEEYTKVRCKGFPAPK